MPKKVFVSYAQAPEAHRLRVAELAASLRAAGLTVLFDQDVTSPQGPPEGWPQWMLDRLEQADWVLVVCNETYYRRFRGREEPGRGLGARWEGTIIGQALYTDGMLNRKFIPVLLDDEDTTAHIPEPLRGATYYRLPAELSKLTRAMSRESPDGPTSSPSPVPVPPPESSRSAVWLGALGALLLVGLLLWNLDLRAKLGLPRPSPTNFPQTDLPVRQKPDHLKHLKGRVQDDQGSPVAGATVKAAGISVITNAAGWFDLSIPGGRVKTDLTLEVMANGYVPFPFRDHVTLNSNDSTIILARIR
jgi:hypothetical protein